MNSRKQKSLPHDNQAEQVVLATILQKGQMPEGLRQEYFFRPAHQIIFEACTALVEKGQVPDSVTVTSWLMDRGEIEKAGGPAYMAELCDIIPLANAARYHVEQLHRKHLRRQMYEVGLRLCQKAYEHGEEGDLLAGAAQEVLGLDNTQREQKGTLIGDIAATCLQQAEYRRNHRGEVVGLPSGFTDLDMKTAGFHPGNLIVIAARPSMGKTALALDIAGHVVVENKTPVAFFSLEMSREELGNRLLCSLGQVDSNKLRKGFLLDSDLARLANARARLSGAKLVIDDNADQSIETIRARARRLKSQHGIGLVIVDYLQLMLSKAEQTREREVAKISRGLKAMAKELQVPVIALSQLSRSLENRTDKRPMLSDLRESGAIEQDADLVCFIYRDEVYNRSPDNPNRGTAEIIIGKQRNGPTGKVLLGFDGPTTTFRNLERREA